MSASLRVGAAATALLFLSACVDRYTIPPAQLVYLNGYDIHREQTVQGATFTDRPYRLTTTQGELVDYNSSKQLVLLSAGGTQLAPPGPFEFISIDDGTFGAKPLVGPPVDVPLQSISHVEIDQDNPEKTSALISIITSAVGLLVTIIALVATSHSAGGAASVGAPHNSALK